MLINNSLPTLFKVFGLLPYLREIFLFINDLFVAFDSVIATILNAKKTPLNTRCCCQVSCCITPPQEQGRGSPDKSIPAMYIVNNSKRTAEAYSPAIRVGMYVSSNAITNSTAGTSHARIPAPSFSRGEAFISFLNSVNESSLLTPAYTNKITSSVQIIMMMVSFFMRV